MARHLNLVHQIWTQFGMNILLAPTKKFAQNLPNLTPKISFQLDIWIPIIRFVQSLAWTYYLTLKTNVCKNFSFGAKSKIDAGGQMSKTD